MLGSVGCQEESLASGRRDACSAHGAKLVDLCISTPHPSHVERPASCLHTTHFHLSPLLPPLPLVHTLQSPCLSPFRPLPLLATISTAPLLLASPGETQSPPGTTRNQYSVLAINILLLQSIYCDFPTRYNSQSIFCSCNQYSVLAINIL